MEKVREVAYHTINETKNQYNKMLKQRYDQNKDNIEFKKGDFVLLFVGNRNVGNKRKFSRKWIGPFIIFILSEHLMDMGNKSRSICLKSGFGSNQLNGR